MIKGLSTDQAPPFSVPIRFFLTLPIFAIAIALIILYYPSEILFNRYTNISIAVVHLFTIGILSMAIMGALQQMLPVMAGISIKNPLQKAMIIHITLILGVALFAIGFIFELKVPKHIASLFLLISYMTFFISLFSLYKVSFLTPTIKAMRFFVPLGVVAILLGITLLLSYDSGFLNSIQPMFLNSHIMFAFFGFAFTLIVGLSFQMIPMFYVSADYTQLIQDHFIKLLFISIILASIYFSKIPFLLLINIYAYATLKRFETRRRKLFEPTLLFWKLSMFSLVLGSLVWIMSDYIDDIRVSSAMFIIFGFGFLYSLIHALIYKIVPFLSWFHLSTLILKELPPNIKEFISDKSIMKNWYFYVSSYILFLSSFFMHELLNIAALVFIISEIIFFINLIKAYQKYTKFKNAT